MEHAPTLASSRIATYQACDAINYTFFSVYWADGLQIPERERRKSDIEMMGEHRLKDIVFCCIKNSPKMRPSTKELAELFQCESEKIKQKERIVKGGREL